MTLVSLVDYTLLRETRKDNPQVPRDQRANLARCRQGDRHRRSHVDALGAGTGAGRGYVSEGTGLADVAGDERRAEGEREVKYRIVERGTPEMLADIVNEFMLDGWKCQGGVSVAALGDDDYLYVQAMIRAEPEQ